MHLKMDKICLMQIIVHIDTVGKFLQVVRILSLAFVCILVTFCYNITKEETR